MPVCGSLMLQRCKIALDIPPSLCCVRAQVVRKGGFRSSLLYNLLGPGEWDVLVMQARYTIFFYFYIGHCRTLPR